MFKYALDRVGKAVYRWGRVNLPDFMCETGFTDTEPCLTLPIATLPASSACQDVTLAQAGSKSLDI